MKFLKSTSNNPYYNLAMEQVIFDQLDQSEAYFFLWQNHNTVVIGKNQNAHCEINAAYANANAVTVARRLSGGGAVYHDLGNVNFTFISDGGSLDFVRFCTPVRDALRALGVAAEITGRNDMVVDGLKFSGNAMYKKGGRVMHHGTIMFDCDLDAVAKALSVSPDKLAGKGVASVRSRVTNIKPLMRQEMNVGAFMDYLEAYMRSCFDMENCALSAAELQQVKTLRDNFYSQKDWIFGANAHYSETRKRRFEGVGSVEIQLEKDSAKRILQISFFGDFFFEKDPKELGDLLRGKHVDEIKDVLQSVNISNYFMNLTRNQFLVLLLGES